MSSGMTMTRPWSPDSQHTDRERWVCIYPAYINSKKTLAEGRKLPKEKCVENPTHQEIQDVLSATGLSVGLENKLYSRERSKELLFRGRIRVQLKRDDGTPFSPEYPTRKSLLYYLGDMIPKLKSRQTKNAPESSHTGGKGKGKGKRK